MRTHSTRRFYFAAAAVVCLLGGDSTIHNRSTSASALLGPVETPADEDPVLVQIEEPIEAVGPDDNDNRAEEAGESEWVESGNPDSIPLLIGYLRDQDEVVQRTALAEFAGMGAKAKRGVPAILVALNDPKSSIRVEAAATLIHMNVQSKAAVRALTTELKAKDAICRERAAQTIGDLIDPPNVYSGCWGPDPPPCIARPWVGKRSLPALEEAKNDRDPRVRAAVAQALTRLQRFSTPKKPNK